MFELDRAMVYFDATDPKAPRRKGASNANLLSSMLCCPCCCCGGGCGDDKNPMSMQGFRYDFYNRLKQANVHINPELFEPMSCCYTMWCANMEAKRMMHITHYYMNKRYGFASVARGGMGAPSRGIYDRLIKGQNW
eukprot:UN03410